MKNDTVVVINKIIYELSEVFYEYTNVKLLH